MSKKFDEMTIGERISYLATQKADSVNAFAVKVLGHKSNSILAGIIRNNNPTYDTLQAIITKTNVNVLWLMEGKGEMFANEQTMSVTPECITAKEALEIARVMVDRITDNHHQAMEMIGRLMAVNEKAVAKLLS